jgi:hypothetical protein
MGMMSSTPQPPGFSPENIARSMAHTGETKVAA